MITALLGQLAARPALVTAVFALALVVLVLPYRVECRRVRGGVVRLYVSLLYRYERGPSYLKLRVDGLRRLQHALLDLLGKAYGLCGAAVSLLRPGLVRSLADELRRRLGL